MLNWKYFPVLIHFKDMQVCLKVRNCGIIAITISAV